MTETSTDFNGFRFLPPSLGAWIKSHIEKRRFEGSIPWTPLPRALNELTFAMVTSAGINHKSDPPFDMEREKQEPLYGDRSYRKISRDTRSADIDVNHLHINTDYIKEDINVILPLERMAELETEGIIDRLAPTAPVMIIRITQSGRIRSGRDHRPPGADCLFILWVSVGKR